MTSNNSKHEALLEELLKIVDGEERIRFIAEDVRSGRDRFRPIPPHDLAEALGVPQPECPAGWQFICSAEISPLEERAEMWSPVSEFVDLLRDKVDPGRFAVLVDLFLPLDDTSEPRFDFLTNEERLLLEEALAERELEANQANGIGTIARFELVSGDDTLCFEATIEDDGYCIFLLTPYDCRDGESQDLSNTVQNSW